MKPGLVIRQTLKPTLTPMLRQALKVLQLNTIELADTVTQELAENPMLEEQSNGEGPALHPATEEDSPAVAESAKTQEVVLDEKQRDNSDVAQERMDEYFWNKEDYEIPKFERHNGPDYSEPQIAQQPTLAEHLLWQFRLVINHEEEFPIGELIVGNLDERGFLTAPLEEIAQISDTSLDQVADVLAIIQNLDPVGVGARDVKESLLIQLRHLPERNPLAEVIVEKHFLALERHQLDQIARAEKTPRSQVAIAAKVIAGLDPYPGRHHISGNVEYVVPDVILEKHDDQYIIIVNDDSLPGLKISGTYRKLLRRGSKITPETRKYLDDRLQRAKWLIRSIDERRKTLYKVVETIVEFQKDFFEKGIEHLKPLNLKQIADQVEVHESTVSRVTSQKYIQTPRGLFRLKYFFSSQIKRSDGSDISSTSVKAAIQEFVAQENPRRPWSDQRITGMLEEKGFQIARRTVAKYREELNLLPASRRKRLE